MTGDSEEEAITAWNRRTESELATAREDYARACHALVEAHGMLKDARAELAALKERLAGLSQRWRDCAQMAKADSNEARRQSNPYGAAYNATIAERWKVAAADLDAMLKENSDDAQQNHDS